MMKSVKVFGVSRLFISPVVNLLLREGKEKCMRAEYEGERVSSRISAIRFFVARGKCTVC